MRLIITGVLFLIGGLSGAMVLRGTGSSGALAFAGLVMVIVGVVQAANGAGGGHRDSAAETAEEDRLRDAEQWEDYQRSKVRAQPSGQALPPEVAALIASTPGAEAQIEELIQRTKGHLEGPQQQEMVVATAKRLANEHRQKEQAAGR